MNWQQAIQQWRDLPETEKHRLRWQRIPLNVAQSMAFEGEPVSLSDLETEHVRRSMPPVTPRPDLAS
jgi:hypothetical protein